MSNQPSEAALEAAKEVIVTLQESYGIEYKGGEPVDNSDWHYWANTLDAFAAQAVAAERARIARQILSGIPYPNPELSTLEFTLTSEERLFLFGGDKEIAATAAQTRLFKWVLAIVQAEAQT